MIASSVMACLQTKHYWSALAFFIIEMNGLPDTSNCRKLVIHQRGAGGLYLPILGHYI
jgi:hypothetical protein